MRVVQIGDNGEIIMWSDFIDADEVSFFQAPDDYSADKYTYTPLVGGGFNINGFALKPLPEDIVNFVKRNVNIQRMNSYMAVQLTQSSFDLFLSDTSTHVTGYLNGGSRLITWVETVNRNGYNATSVGFKTKASYRGTPVEGVYERAEAILAILNDL